MGNNMKNRTLRDLPLTLRVPDIAELLGIGRNTAYKLIKTGELKSIRIGKQIRIPRDKLIRFLTR